MGSIRNVLYGYSIEKGVIVLNREEAPIVFEAFNRYCVGEILKDIVDSAIASRIIPQLDGYDFNKLVQFFDAVQNDSVFSYMKRTKDTIYRLIH